MHLHAAKAPQMRRDGRPQPRRSLRPRRLQHRALALVGQHAPQRPCPRRVGKHPFRRRRPREVGEPFASGAWRNPSQTLFAVGSAKRGAFSGKFFELFDAIIPRNPRFGPARRAFGPRTVPKRDFYLCGCRNPRKTCQIRPDFLNIETAAGHGAHIALGHQLIVGPLYGDDAHSQMLRERPLGRETRAGRKSTRLDVGSKRPVKLLVQARLPSAI